MHRKETGRSDDSMAGRKEGRRERWNDYKIARRRDKIEKRWNEDKVDGWNAVVME